MRNKHSLGNKFLGIVFLAIVIGTFLVTVSLFVHWDQPTLSFEPERIFSLSLFETYRNSWILTDLVANDWWTLSDNHYRLKHHRISYSQHLNDSLIWLHIVQLDSVYICNFVPAFRSNAIDHILYVSKNNYDKQEKH